MKVLFFISSSMERPSPSWHLMKALLEDVLASGIDVHAIQRHFCDSDGPAFPDTIQNHEGFAYTSINDNDVSSKSLPIRYLNGIRYAWRSRSAFRAHADYDIVFIQSSPTALFYIMVAWHYAKGRPIVYNSQDLFPGSAIANGSMPWRWMQGLFRILQRKAYQKASVITAISDDMKERLKDERVSETKVRVIPNWYDDLAVREIDWDNNRFARKYNLSRDVFYVQYAGTMGTNFNPDVVLEVAELLISNERIVFQMIGGGARRDQFESEAMRRGLENIVFYPLQEQDMVSDVYSAASICLIPLKEGVIGNSVPSKMGLLMACKRIIVTSVDQESEYSKVFLRNQIGFSFGTKDAKGIADTIVALSQNPRMRDEYSRRAKEYGERELSRSVLTRRYISLFKELLEK